MHNWNSRLTGEKIQIKALLLCTLIFIGSTMSAQITFEKTFGGDENDFGFAVGQTTDGGYILFGQTQSFGNGLQDMYLVKTDEEGNETWSQTYGGLDYEFGISAQQTLDGGYILCGGYSGIGNDSLALIKTDSNGNEIWNNRFSGTASRDVGQFVQQTFDGGFIAVGFTGDAPSEDIYMVKTDIDGNEEWSKVHTNSGRQLAVGVRQTSDGGYIMVGETNSELLGEKDMYLVKTNSTGDTLWTKAFGSGQDEIGRSISITSDGGFILLGYQDFVGGDLYLLKTDALGNEEWSTYYGGSGWDMGHSVQQTTDGGFVLAGRKENTVAGTYELYCLKTDDVGSTVWESTFPNGLLSNANAVEETADGGYILLGSASDPFQGVNSNMYLVKVDELGVVSVLENAAPELLVSAYPNPFADFAIIEWNDTKNRSLSLIITNSQGQVLRSQNNIENDRIRVERDNLTSGLYFFHISHGSEVIAAGKLLVK